MVSNVWKFMQESRIIFSIIIKVGAIYNARMWTENDLNESEIDLNECEHFLKANLDWDEFKLGRWLLKVLNEFSVQFLEKNKEILSSKRFQYTLAFFLSFAYR